MCTGATLRDDLRRFMTIATKYSGANGTSSRRDSHAGPLVAIIRDQVIDVALCRHHRDWKDDSESSLAGCQHPQSVSATATDAAPACPWTTPAHDGRINVDAPS